VVENDGEGTRMRGLEENPGSKKWKQKQKRQTKKNSRGDIPRDSVVGHLNAHGLNGRFFLSARGDRRGGGKVDLAVTTDATMIGHSVRASERPDIAKVKKKKERKGG
jgi:hypothetical protein